jgi:hypothetical protein
MDTKIHWMDDLVRTPQQHSVRVDNCIVPPHVLHFMQVPFRTSLEMSHSLHISVSQ